MHKLFHIFLLSMIPVSELRAAIPAGILIGLDPVTVYFVSVIGNMIPVPFIILFIRKILQWLRKISPRFEAFVKRFEARIEKKAERVKRYEMFGLLIFVAIPLPGTGAWTGAAVASLLNMHRRHALPMIFGGVLIAGLIVTAITLTGTTIAQS